MLHIGVDLQQRFCFMTAMETSGKIRQQGRVANEPASRRGYFGQWREPVEAAVEACSFWPAFFAAVELPAAARQAVDTYLGLLTAYDQQVGAWEEHWAEAEEGDERVGWLESIPGFGSYAARLVLAEIDDLHRFASKRQLYSYAGLVPRVRESGERQRRGGITRSGSPRLRWILVQAAHSASRHSPAARAYFQRLARGKHPQLAGVALARKLLGAVWALLRDGVCFDEEVFAAR